MGVLHMAIPAAGVFPRQPGTNSRAAVRTTGQPNTASAGTEPEAAVDGALRNTGQRWSLSGTLLPSASTTPHPPPRNSARRPGHEATLQRTPEQEAAQEAQIG